MMNPVILYLILCGVVVGVACILTPGVLRVFRGLTFFPRRVSTGNRERPTMWY